MFFIFSNIKLLVVFINKNNYSTFEYIFNIKFSFFDEYCEQHYPSLTHMSIGCKPDV